MAEGFAGLIPDYAEFIIGPAEGRTRWLHPGYGSVGQALVDAVTSGAALRIGARRYSVRVEMCRRALNPAHQSPCRNRAGRAGESP